MIPKADIVDIIQQLIRVSLPSDKLDRPNEIRNLTPICDISEGPPPPTDPEFSFYVSKVTPKGHELILRNFRLRCR